MLRAAPLLCLALLAADAAAQQVHRCVGADGQAVFSDRSCADLGATPRLPPASSTHAGATDVRHYRGGCARTLGDLSMEIGAAIRNRDLNRLSSLYDWQGVSSAGARQRLDRLEAIVSRPLVDIAPVHPQPSADPPPMPPVESPADPQAAGTDAWPTGAAAPPAARPTGLRIEQTLANGSTPSRTVFGLRRRFGCFWIHL